MLTAAFLASSLILPLSSHAVPRLCPLEAQQAVAPGAAAESEDLKKIERLNAQIIRLYNARRFRDAVVLAEEVLRLSMTSGAATKADVFGAVGNLAQLYRQTKRDDEAEKMYRLAVTLAVEAGLGDSADVGVTHDNLGRLLLTSGRLDEADRESQEAVRILTAALGPKHPSLAGALNNRALLLAEKRDYVAAEQHCLDAIAMLQATIGQHNLQIDPFVDDLKEIRRMKAEHEAAAPVTPPDDDPIDR